MGVSASVEVACQPNAISLLYVVKLLICWVNGTKILLPHFLSSLFSSNPAKVAIIKKIKPFITHLKKQI